ncbi:MAG: hypothetical protein B6U95_04860 [Thermofilum sp. ex4484_82]|nr:MAG: hypothetical protein B6U95_04860 [Thermofilum sp. ex4484_82]OYT38245.1 MAG: hypothetical protein B6U96_04855 [Archaeoglobales archaeon ex4484_92]
MDEREVIGFYKDHRIEKIRPITVRKGKNKEIKKERFMRSIGISRQTVGEICNLLKKEFPKFPPVVSVEMIPSWSEKDKIFTITKRILDNRSVVAVFTDYIKKYYVISFGREIERKFAGFCSKYRIVKILEIDANGRTSYSEHAVYDPYYLLDFRSTRYCLQIDDDLFEALKRTIRGFPYGFSKKLIILPFHTFFFGYGEDIPRKLYKILETPKTATICCEPYSEENDYPIYIGYAVYKTTRKEEVLELNRELAEFNMKLQKKKYEGELKKTRPPTKDLIVFEEMLKFVKRKGIARKIGIQAKNLEKIIREIEHQKRYKLKGTFKS